MSKLNKKPDVFEEVLFKPLKVVLSIMGTLGLYFAKSVVNNSKQDINEQNHYGNDEWGWGYEDKYRSWHDDEND